MRFENRPRTDARPIFAAVKSFRNGARSVFTRAMTIAAVRGLFSLLKTLFATMRGQFLD